MSDMAQRQLPHLTLSEAEMRRIMANVGNMIVDHFVNLKNMPVTSPSTLNDLRSGLQEPLPLSPTAMADILDQFRTHVLSEMTHNDHPRNFAFVPGPSNFIGANEAGELHTCNTNPHAGTESERRLL